MSSATSPSPIFQTDTIPSSMTLPPVTPTPLKRKPSADPSTPPRESLKRPRLDSQRLSTDETLRSTKHYAVYFHNLLEDPESANHQLLSASTVFESTQKAMRDHATQAIEANVQWGATRELSTNRLYEILDSKNHVVLRYEMDIVFPTGENVDGVKQWSRASELEALPVQYGLCVEYLNDNYDEEEGAERSLVVTFSSLGEAKHAMKKSAAAYIGSSSGVKVSERRIEMVGEEGEVLRRYKIEDGRRDAQGRFIREEDLYLELSGADATTVPADLSPAPERLESPAPPSPQPIVAPAITAVVRQAIPEVASNSPAPATPEPEATQGTRRQSARIKVETQAAKDMKEEQAKVEIKPKPQPKSKAPAQPKAPAKPKTPAKSKAKAKTSAQTPVDTSSHCTCRGLDDGSLMIGCDNDACPIGWYHGRCIGISKPIPKNQEWYCAMCTKEMENNKDKGVGAVIVKTPAKKRGSGGGVKTKTKTKAKARKRK
ncbi:uncharacterized protein J4E88_006125 [Alternaria novae-zelandiae]|uniref:uncharacterized protein n=1 Tax=Alternaria novae-zelandiae TaxID=430562 RepID=UPI0020C47CEF|nr:uncharacterized protein J4E88_006125 [Alternaria novae-zelandiae]KAI4680233.1 hypothetical protein J4E88_006125 [Alternaria novae-zelandiae]